MCLGNFLLQNDFNIHPYVNYNPKSLFSIIFTPETSISKFVCDYLFAFLQILSTKNGFKKSYMFQTH